MKQYSHQRYCLIILSNHLHVSNITIAEDFEGIIGIKHKKDLAGNRGLPNINGRIGKALTGLFGKSTTIAAEILGQLKAVKSTATAIHKTNDKLL